MAPLALTASLIVLALSPGTALAGPGALDGGFGDNGKVVTQAPPGNRFNSAVHIAEGPNETIVAASGKAVFRYLPDGSLDPSFGDGGKVSIADPEGLPFTLSDLVVDGSGRIILLGKVEIPDVWVPISYISSANPVLAAVIRYTPDGQLDPGFGGGSGFLVTDLGQKSPYGPGAPYEKALTSFTTGVADRDGRLIAIGSVGEIVTSFRSEIVIIPQIIARLTPAGQLDPAFGGGDGVISETGLEGLTDLAVYGDDGLLAAGADRRRRGIPQGALTRFGLDGEIDPSFGRMGTRNGLFVPPLADMAVDGFGRIIVLAGRGVMRLTPGGALDRSFGNRGGVNVKLPGKSTLDSIVVESSGQMLLAGTQSIHKRAPTTASENPYRSCFTVIELGQRGGPDRRFGNGGWITTRFGKGSAETAEDAFVDRENRLVVAGAIFRPDLAPAGGIALARYNLGG